MEEPIKPTHLFEIEIDNSIKKLLLELALWARAVAVCSMLAYAVGIVKTVMEYLGFRQGNVSTVSLGVEMAVFSISTAIGVIVNVFLLRFGSMTRQAVNNLDQQSLDHGFFCLRNYYKIIGIITIVFLAVLVLSVLLTITRSW